MILFKNKYNFSLLLAIFMLMMVSCQKGGEPIPKFVDVNTSSEEEVISAVFRGGGDMEDGSDENSDDDLVYERDDSDEGIGNVVDRWYRKSCRRINKSITRSS